MLFRSGGGGQCISHDPPKCMDGFIQKVSPSGVVSLVKLFPFKDLEAMRHIDDDDFDSYPYTPGQEVEDIQDFFDNSVNKGTLTGVGPTPTSAKGKREALSNMLKLAEYFIDNGLVSEACQQLKDAYLKTDGNPKPRDFVSGPGASKLASMIQDLMANLGCQ